MKKFRIQPVYFGSVLFTTMLLCVVSHANANIACAGRLGYLGIDQVGQVAVANGAGINTICSATSQGSFEINVQTCKQFYATLLALRISSRSVTIYYRDSNLTSCSQIGGWSVQPSAYFIEMAD